MSESPSRKASLRTKYGIGSEATEYHEHKELPDIALRKEVLSRAICDYLGYSIIEPHIKREARQWLFSKSRNRYWIFTFENICNDLDLDMATVRKQILAEEAERAEEAAKRNRQEAAEKNRYLYLPVVFSQTKLFRLPLPQLLLS